MQTWEIKLILLVLYTENGLVQNTVEDGKKMIIRNPTGLDAAIMKGKLV